jgi:hypothetical protein
MEIDGDGLNELIVSRTDRMLHIFKFFLDETAELGTNLSDFSRVRFAHSDSYVRS